GANYAARSTGGPARSADEIAAVSPPGSGESLAEKSGLLLLKTAEGVKVTPMDRIQDITFATDPKPKLANEEFRNLLTLKLDWGEREPRRPAEVGLMYLQRGIRSIPGFKISIEGDDKAKVKPAAPLRRA